MRVEFQTPEYQADGSFQNVKYAFEGEDSEGWRVFRENKQVLDLGQGYTLLQSEYCGVCSTDLARRFLPYELPQIIGHEVVGKQDGKSYVVEINASHEARGIESDCKFCNNDLNTQCPDRITLGIDRLPGGFAPYFLAPTQAMIQVPENISKLAACMTEPFAAALHGVESTPIENGDSVAVLGPRKLGMLAIAALVGYRKSSGKSFEIVALGRHQPLLEIAKNLGADRIIDLRKEKLTPQSFTVVFDTTGKPEGLEIALEAAKKIVHLKSTNGQVIFGMKHLTDLVVDELSLLPFEGNIDFKWANESVLHNQSLYVSPSIQTDLSHLKNVDIYRETVKDALAEFQKRDFPPHSVYPRFDAALVRDFSEVDDVIRPQPGKELSLVRPRGAIYIQNPKGDHPLAKAMSRGLQLRSSRCGDFHRALHILSTHPEIAQSLERQMITQKYGLDEIVKAFETASDSERSIKVVVEMTSLS